MAQDILPGISTLTVQELDGTPTVQYVQGLLFPNGTLTDNGDGTVTVNVSANAWVQGGNAFGALGVLGTTDAHDLSVIRNGTEVMRVTTGEVLITGAAEVDANNASYVGSVAAAFGTLTGSSAGMGGRALEGQIIFNGAGGTTDTDTAGVQGSVDIHGSVASSQIAGVRGYVTSGTSATVTQARSISGDPISNSGGGTITKAISIYGDLQTAGTSNYSGYFEGDVYIGGNLSLAGTGGGGSSITMTQVHEHVYQEDHTAETNGSLTNFVCAQEFSQFTTMIWKSGLLLQPTVDYTEDSTLDAVTLTSAPSASTPLIFAYIPA